MKSTMIFFLLFLTRAEAAPLCEVFGISDSPQRLVCKFGREELEVRCHEGVYFLGAEKVEDAFHYEVEDGPVPLVFKTKDLELTVTLGTRIQHKASLTGNGSQRRGSCKL